MSDPGEELFSLLDLTEYESIALDELPLIGRTTAPDLAEATWVPKARIYGVLDKLCAAGFVKLIPGRPKQYEPHDPADIVDRAIENQRDTYEQFRSAVESIEGSFIDTYSPIQNKTTEQLSPTEDLFHVVNVGEPSERETRRLFREATDRVVLLTKSFGFIDAVRSAMRDALDRDVTVDILMLGTEHLSMPNERRQREIRRAIAVDFPDAEVRISDRVLPWRGTFIDPTLSYESGQGLFLVEQESIPNHHRQAAVTENPPFVAGLWQCFDLLWQYESHPDTLSSDDTE